MGLVEIVLTLLLGLLVVEASDWLPWLTTFVIRRAVQRLPQDVRSRYQEEWLADAEQIPGKLARLFWALDLIRASYKMPAGDREPTKRRVAAGVGVSHGVATAFAVGHAARGLDSSEIEVTCGSCDVALDEPAGRPPAERLPCPRCGSTSRSIRVSIPTGVLMVDGASVEVRTTKYQ